MPRPHISYSELASFATGCQWRWKLDYLENRRVDVFSIHFDYGGALHEAFEKYLTRKNPLDVDSAVKLFQEKLRKDVVENGPKYEEGPLPEKELNLLLAAGEACIRFVKSVPELQDAEYLMNEMRLHEPIAREDGIDIKFKGFIDFIFKSKDKRGKPVVWVCDFKTCSWGWDREKREDRWKHYQIFLYKHFLCKKLDIDPQQVRTAFILLKKRPPKGKDPVEFFPISAGPISVQRALDALGSNITEMAEREKDGSFKKDRSQCVSYGRTCPFFNTSACPKD